MKIPDDPVAAHDQLAARALDLIRTQCPICGETSFYLAGPHVGKPCPMAPGHPAEWLVSLLREILETQKVILELLRENLPLIAGERAEDPPPFTTGGLIRGPLTVGVDRTMVDLGDRGRKRCPRCLEYHRVDQDCAR